MLEQAVNKDFLGKELLQLWIAELFRCRLDSQSLKEVEGTASLLLAVLLYQLLETSQLFDLLCIRLILNLRLLQLVFDQSMYILAFFDQW